MKCSNHREFRDKYKFIIDEGVVDGHETYLSLMQMINNQDINVSTDREFQRLYKGYYFPGPQSHEFSNSYFQYMQEVRNQNPSFRDVIEHIYVFSNQVHYSFASKLLHTVDPQNPVLDKHIMRLLGFNLMERGNPTDRKNFYCNVFETVSNEYRSYENMPFMQEVINQFNELFPDYREISYSKKVDMLLFRLKNERSISFLDYMFCSQGDRK